MGRSITIKWGWGGNDKENEATSARRGSELYQFLRNNRYGNKLQNNCAIGGVNASPISQKGNKEVGMFQIPYGIFKFYRGESPFSYIAYSTKRINVLSSWEIGIIAYI